MTPLTRVELSLVEDDKRCDVDREPLKGDVEGTRDETSFVAIISCEVERQPLKGETEEGD